MLVVGTAAAVLGGGGYGVAVRTEYQANGDTTLGLELTGGVASSRTKGKDGVFFRSGLIAARGYGRYSVGEHAALTFGSGLAVLGSGAVTLQLHGGVLVGYTNDYATPVAQLSVALAVPFIEGKAYGDGIWLRPGPKQPPVQFLTPRADLFIATDVGVIIPTSDANTVSLDFGLAFATHAKDILMSLSAADAYDSRTP